ncbi:YciI family protein [Nonomuraea soli]|uniref:YCII-related domain-containing protein n=1 Tax=Nonomuraea soli TaxID=1032476 RepID=A0A7W0CKA7_9ACTN|nr:YciI family protein [Nonomuraea soli]MBA2892634.1 hypothetical protein [Nonomuraea soli]
MRYLMMIAGLESALPSDEEVVADPAHGDWLREMRRRGVLVTAARLRGSEDATSVQVRDDAVLIADGPFAESKEQIAGFALLDCRDLDEAIEVAAAHPVARVGVIEVRPLWE